MCGIAAMFSDAPVADQEIRRLTGLVSHRGPNGISARLFCGDRAALGHTRLAIQDLSTRADQPMISPDGRHVIIFNGEIYNFHEIRQRLQKRGITFSTQSDTEVILHAWREQGVDCLHEFNGMWAFLIFDTVTQETVLVRDRFGVKPVYYHQTPQRLLICSEIDAIGRFCGFRMGVNEHYLQQFVSGQTVQFASSDTHLKGVHPLPAGHLVRFGPDRQLKFERWYTLRRRMVPRHLQQQADELQDLLSDACRIRLRSDVPVATCLSGGIDSGSIVCILNQLQRQGGDTGAFSHRSFTAAFPGTHLDESHLTELLAARNNIQLDRLVVDCPSPDTLESALSACDGPMPALAFYPIWALYRHIRNSGIAVTLDGQGADEMLGGYYVGPDALLSGWQSRNPFRMHDLWKTYCALHENGTAWMRDALQSTKRYAQGEIQLLLKAPIKAIGAYLGLYTPRGNRMPSPLPRPAAVPAMDPDEGDWLAHKLWDQFFVNPLPFLLHQYDRCSMASGVECRMPFMDYRLVEFLFSCPLSSRIGGGYTKRILREAMRNLLPDEIRTNRIKTGFNAPFSMWLNGPLKEWLMDQIRSKAFMDHSLFDGTSIGSTSNLNGVLNSDAWDERKLWPCLHLSWWQRQSRSTAGYDIQST